MIPVNVHSIHFVGLAKGFQSYAPFSNFGYILICCDKTCIGGLIITISDSS